MQRRWTRTWLTTAAVTAAWLSLGQLSAGCSGGTEAKAAAVDALPYAKVTDMLHAVMESDRTVDTKQVVNRLVKKQKVEIINPKTEAKEKFGASEQWKSEHGKLPLPAQMFRMGAEGVAKKDVGFTYSLLSEWPVNKQNKPRTKVETEGLKFINANKGKAPFYGEEELGGKKYFTGVYADVGVAAACIDCHNDHKDSPRRDFKLGDVMGGVVIRIPMGK